MNESEIPPVSWLKCRESSRDTDVQECRVFWCVCMHMNCTSSWDISVHVWMCIHSMPGIFKNWNTVGALRTNVVPYEYVLDVYFKNVWNVQFRRNVLLPGLLWFSDNWGSYLRGRRPLTEYAVFWGISSTCLRTCMHSVLWYPSYPCNLLMSSEPLSLSYYNDIWPTPELPALKPI